MSLKARQYLQSLIHFWNYGGLYHTERVQEFVYFHKPLQMWYLYNTEIMWSGQEYSFP